MNTDGAYPPHFDGERYFNPGYGEHPSLWDFLRWRMKRGRRYPWPRNVLNPPPDLPPERVDGAALRVSYVGHVTALLQTCGVNVLTDPVWSKRASPVPFAGPRRCRKPGLTLDALPPLDAILVSHNHYDHLDRATLARLAVKRPAPVFTPLGNARLIAKAAPHLTVHEMDWGDVADLGNGVRLHLEPMLHWSARGVRDRNIALWGAFVLETPHGNVLFIGDTAYGAGETFRHHRSKFGGFRLALLPIGAYLPRWFMKFSHMDPEEAVRAMKDLNAANALATHYEVFPLADDRFDAPRRALEAARERHQVAPERFPTLEPGAAWWVPELSPEVAPEQAPQRTGFSTDVARFGTPEGQAPRLSRPGRPGVKSGVRLGRSG